MLLEKLDRFLEARIEQFEKNKPVFIGASLAVLIVTFYVIYSLVSSIVINSNINSMKELANHDKQAIKNSVYFRQQEIQNLSESLWRHRILSLQGLHEHLRTTNDQFGMHRISVVSEEGVLYSSNGTSKRDDVYAELIRLNPKGFVTRHGGKNGVILFGAPVHAFRVENERFNYVLGEVLVRDLADSMEISILEDEGFSCVIDNNGEFIVAAKGRSENNLFEEFSGANVKGYADKEAFAKDIKARKEITTTMNYEGEDYILVASPTDYKWTIVSIAPKSIFQSLTNRITGIFVVLALVVVGAIGIVVMLLLRSRARQEKASITARYAEELQEKNIELMASQEQLQENQVRLEEAVAEQEAHIAEVTTLNEQLQENQARLEEASAEQEAHIEEVTSLNVQLQENQAQLEEAIAENEAQLEELEASKDELMRAQAAAEAANAAKTSFLFNMSHDIRTPMNAIMGFRDLLEKHQEDPARRADYLRKIEDSSAVLLSIINNVLEMARIEKGTIEIDETAWSAEQFNDTLYSVFHDLMLQKGIIFTREVKVTNKYVMCDPIKLREVFINIISNAYKYTNPGGKVHMLLEEIPSDKPGYALYRTTISDTGIGMTEEFLPHIFEEFSREANSTETKIEGTGLGMPIVKRLVDLMEGTVEVNSKKGEGTTFVVTIPHKITDKSSLVEHFGVEIDPHLFEGKRILLAEDNELNAEIAIEILGEASFIVERAENGAVCVDMLAQAPNDYYDLILMDIQMPYMNGYEATRAIRSMSDSAKSKIKILAMTANAFEEDKREAFRVGMNGHLAKPVNIHELMKTLAGILG